MKILALEEGFPPELTSSHFALEFAQELARRGHSISVVTVFPRKHLLKTPVCIPKSKFFYWDPNYNKVRVLRIFPQFRNASQVGRAIEYLVSAVSLLAGGLISRDKKDIIHVGTPPLFVAFSACILGRVKRTPVILRIWDIHPDALEKIGAIKNKFLIGAMKFIERFVYRYVEHITIISQSYKDYLINQGVPEQKITMIPNWARLKSLQSNPSGYEFRKAFGLKDKFVVTYAGSLSWQNDLETIIESANLLKEHKDIVFVFCGNGIKKDSTMQMSKNLSLNNTLFIPPRPIEEYLRIISESDVSVVSYTKDFNTPALPARLANTLACAKPVIANVPFESDTYYLINNAKCGFWVEPGDAKSLAAFVLKLNEDRNIGELFGLNSKKYADENFSIYSCMNSYDRVLQSIAGKKRTQDA
jgi:glycosyltransferase involved in cell wall biosynthesis